MSCKLPTLRSSKGVLVVFFFSSRRRHTRYWRDWSSDVCSSDLTCVLKISRQPLGREENVVAVLCHGFLHATRSEERRVGKSVDLGGRRIIKKKKKKNTECNPETKSKDNRQCRRRRYKRRGCHLL